MSFEFDKTLTVLIIENSPLDRKMLRGMLRTTPNGTFDVLAADSMSRALNILKKTRVDVCILDLNLNDCIGLDSLKQINDCHPDLPMVVNTGAYQDDLGLLAIARGAQDYLIKGKFTPYGLSKSLYYAVERKRFEQELKAATLRIQETQSQLIQMEKMNVIGGIASGVAHEVKNPLATILYGIDFLNTKLDRKDEGIRLTMKSIREAANKANRIVGDLLDFASLSNLKREKEDINQLIEHSISFVQLQCINKRIAIKREYGQDIPLISIDKNRIEQVMIDLLFNAVHAMEEGGILTVRTRHKFFDQKDCLNRGLQNSFFKSGDEVIITDLIDTGIGIDEQDLPRLFEPFFTTRRAAGGVGLGLSVSRTIMKNHRGLISLQNTPERNGAMARLIFHVR